MIAIFPHVLKGLIGEMIENKMKKNIIMITGLSLFLMVTSCDKTKSYSELLTEEEHAVNWYMAQQTIVPYVPADSVFETGTSAPFYKMDEDGFVYMQVINNGNLKNRPKKGETVYYRYRYKNVKDMYSGYEPSWLGNVDNLIQSPSSLVFGTTVLTSTLELGEGLQVPLKYLGYDCEVNIVIKSPKGHTKLQTECIPYLYNIKYFKAEY